MNLTPDESHLRAVERWTLLCGALLIPLSFLFLGPRGQLGVCLGAGLMALNARLLRVLGARLRQVYSDRPPSLALLLVLQGGKFLGLALLIFICLHYLPVEPLPFILGVSILPVAIVLTAIGRGVPLHDGGPAKPPASSGEA